MTRHEFAQAERQRRARPVRRDARSRLPLVSLGEYAVPDRSEHADVAISWEIYERTKSNLALALVGLVQIVPVVGLFMPAGHLIDRVDRQKILMAALARALSVRRAWRTARRPISASWWMYAAAAVDRRRPHVRAAGAGRVPAADRSARGLQQRRHLALERISALERRGAGTGGRTDRLVAHCDADLRTHGGDGAGQFVVSGDDSPPAVCSIHRAAVAGVAGGGSVIRVADKGHAGGHYARYVCRTARRGDGAVARCMRRTFCIVGPAGFGWMRAAPGIGAVVHVVSHGASSAVGTRRAGTARGGRRVRGGDDCFRVVAVVSAVAWRCCSCSAHST